MPHRYSPGQPIRRRSNIKLSIIAQEPLKAMFRPPLRPRMADRTSSLQSALDDSIAEQYQPSFGHDIMESDNDFLEELNEMKAGDRILKEVADWLDLDERDWQQALRHRRLQRLFPREDTSNENPHHTLTMVPTSLEPSEADVHSIAVQLLASCYTISQDPGSASMPASLYMNRRSPESVSALRMHAQHRFSPASGYHARDPSYAPAWPGLFHGPSREEELADEVTRRRVLKRLEKEGDKVESLEEFIQWSNQSILDPDELRLAQSDSDSSECEPGAPATSATWPGARAATQQATAPWKSRARSFAFPGALHITSEHTRKSALKHSRSTAMLRTPEALRAEKSKRLHTWSLKPMLRNNPHPVFLQPMRQLRLRRVGSFPRRPTREERSSIVDWANHVQWTASMTQLLAQTKSSDDDIDLTPNEADQLLTAQEYLSGTAFDDERTAFAGEDHKNFERVSDEFGDSSNPEVQGAPSDGTPDKGYAA